MERQELYSCRLGAIHLSGSVQLRKSSLPNHVVQGVTSCVTSWTSCVSGLYECPNASLMARPKTLKEVSSLVLQYSSIKAIGAGLSWNKEQFCPEDSSNAIGIAMTELINLRPL